MTNLDLTSPRHYIECFSGSSLDFDNPKEYFKRPISEIFTDIANVLPYVYRYAGHTIQPYSVAEHTMIGCALMQERFGLANANLILGFAIHDAHEAYTGDITNPLQRKLRDMIETKTGVKYDPLAELQASIDSALQERLGLKLTQVDKQIIREVDVQMCYKFEKDQVFGRPMEWGDGGVPPIPQDFIEKNKLFKRQPVTPEIFLSFLNSRLTIARCFGAINVPD
jgi:hypothetical protein